MGNKRNEELWNKVMEYYNDGYTKAQIGRFVGLSRQRISVIIDSYEKNQQKILGGNIRLSDFQLRKLESVVFDNIRIFLIQSNIKLGDFCKMIDKESKTTYRAIAFLTGKSNNVTPEMISKIAKVTGLPIEEVLKVKSNENNLQL